MSFIGGMFVLFLFVCVVLFVCFVLVFIIKKEKNFWRNQNFNQAVKQGSNYSNECDISNVSVKALRHSKQVRIQEYIF